MAEARKAVAQGTAEDEQIQMAANGVTVNGDGRVVPATNGNSDLPVPRLNGSERNHRDPEVSEDQSPSVRDRMDISLHNLNDEQR